VGGEEKKGGDAEYKEEMGKENVGKGEVERRGGGEGKKMERKGRVGRV